MTIFAGPMMNFVLAFFIFLIIGLFQGVEVNEARLGQLTDDGPAIASGLQTGDQIETVAGAEVSNWLDVQENIQKNPGKEIEFVVIRDGETLSIPVVPKEIERNGETIGIIGVYPPVEKGNF